MKRISEDNLCDNVMYINFFFLFLSIFFLHISCIYILYDGGYMERGKNCVVERNNLKENAKGSLKAS